MEPIAPFSADVETPYRLDELLARCNGKVELAQRVLRTFRAQFGTYIDQCEEALVNADLGELAAVAHKMKGSTASVGAHGLNQLAQSIEAHSLEQRLDEVERLVQQLDEDWQRIEEIDVDQFMGK